MKSEAAPCQAALLEPVFSPPDADRRATLSPLALLAALSAESFRSMLSAQQRLLSLSGKASQ